MRIGKEDDVRNKMEYTEDIPNVLDASARDGTQI